MKRKDKPMNRIFLLLLISISLHAADILYPADVQTALADYEAKVAKAKADLVIKLTKAQDAATKKGDLDLALTIKAKVAEYATKDGDKPAASPQAIKAELKQRLTGTFDFAFPTGHTGQLVINKQHATDKVPGIEGDLRFTDDTAVVDWSNGSHWTVSLRDGDLVVQASDGRSTLKVAAK